ncbi:MAG TPA: hypothetical protein VJH92_03660 [Candidatus Nanoarchaeia archaeon]|nr:hypothetical protein [Candidatus Nanoarchaeia archaeon]
MVTKLGVKKRDITVGLIISGMKYHSYTTKRYNTFLLCLAETVTIDERRLLI